MLDTRVDDELESGAYEWVNSVPEAAKGVRQRRHPNS